MNLMDNIMKKYFMQKVDGYSIVNENTGEISELHVVKKVDINEFVMMFLLSIDEINEKLKGNEIKVLLACVRCSKISSYEESGNSFLTCSREFKNLVTGIKPQNVCKYLAKLNELGFIKRISRSEYELNPLYFFRGTLTQRTKCLMKIETNEQTN